VQLKAPALKFTRCGRRLDQNHGWVDWEKKGSRFSRHRRVPRWK
jgi:hypothetical protein